MELNKKVIVAIASAIGSYIQDEEAAWALQEKSLAQRPPQAFSPYAMAGRLAAMNARWTWQMRLVR